MDLALVAQLVADGPMPLVRTDFSSDDAWQRVVEHVTNEWDAGGIGYTANVEPVSDPAFDSTTPDALAAAWPREVHGYVMLADERSMGEASSGGDPTVVVVDLSADDEDEEFGWVFGREFRCVASEVAGIEANLSIANMDFAEFADSADDDGVFRGF